MKKRNMRIGRFKLLQQVCHDYELDLGELMERYNVSRPAKRNRKRGSHHDGMIEMEEYTFMGQEFLVDNKNNAFKYESAGGTVLLVGKRTSSGRIELLDFDSDHS